MLRYALTFIILFILCHGIKAQIWLSNEDIFAEAEEYLEAEDYLEALPLYQLLEKKGLGNANISYKIGQCLLNIPGKKAKSLPYLKEASMNISSQSREKSFEEQRAPLKCLLLMGVAYRLQNDFENAINTFSALKDSIGSSNQELLQIVNMHIERCNNAKKILPYPAEYHPFKLDETINNEYSNVRPAVTQDEKVIYYMEVLPFYDALMYSEKQGKDWQVPENLTPKIGSDGDHLLVSISSDGNHLLLYGYESMFAGEIYEAIKHNDKWSKVSKLEGDVNSQYHETHASFSPGNNILYFTSNRPGGYGGMDIYSARKSEDGQWLEIKNLGRSVNSPFNEECPFLSGDGNRLYFSSQGHINMGGYDYFVSERDNENNAWKEPVNLGAPYSTTDDDVFYYPVGDGSIGYVSNMRDGQGDIFRLELVKPSEPRVYKIFGHIQYPEETDTSAVDVLVSHKNKNDTVSLFKTDDKGYYEEYLPQGVFQLRYHVGESEGFSEISITSDSPVEAMLVESSLTKREFIQKDTIKLQRILFGFDSYKVGTTYYQYIDEVVAILKKYENARVIITGHTDNIGSESYNEILSLKRATFVKNMMVKKGADVKRIIVLGKGEIYPIAKNDHAEGRNYNRRAELKFKDLEDVLIIIPAISVPEKFRINP